MGALGWGTDHDLRFCLLTATCLYSCRFNEGKDTEIFSNVTWEAGGWRTRGPQTWNHHLSRILVRGLCNVSKVLCPTSSSMIFIPRLVYRTQREGGMLSRKEAMYQYCSISATTQQLFKHLNDFPTANIRCCKFCYSTRFAQFAGPGLETVFLPLWLPF